MPVGSFTRVQLYSSTYLQLHKQKGFVQNEVQDQLQRICGCVLEVGGDGAYHRHDRVIGIDNSAR